LRQNALTYDGVLAYDPLGGSYAFSPIGLSGNNLPGGNTENCRDSTSLKYRLKLGQFRVAALWQFSGYGQNNGSDGAYQVGIGADITTLAKACSPSTSFTAMSEIHSCAGKRSRQSDTAVAAADDSR
jgi:hypothetical protein